MIRKVTEKTLEKNLQKEVKNREGKTYKFSSPMNAGVFDRIVILPKGQVWFVEMKSPGKTLSPLQQVFEKDMKNLGCRTFVISNLEQFKEFLNIIDREI